MIKIGKTQLQDAQKNPVEVEQAKLLSPVEFYNRYMRKEGEKVLTEEDYDRIQKLKDAFILKGRKGNAIIMHPKTPDECTDKPTTDD